MTHLQNKDKTLYDMIERESVRQSQSLELIASENYTSKAVMECLGSCLTNKYSEGYPGKRYYGGNKHIDEIETLCIQRALTAFRLDPSIWGVNVQPYSGSPANFAVYNALLDKSDRIMGLDLPSGGHLTHGFYTSKRKVSATSKYFESMPYHIKEDGYIDYDELERSATIFKPKMIISGFSAYPRNLDFKRFRSIADKVGAYLMCDMAHISGLVATQYASNPFEVCDIVTTTTHKTLRGPRAGMIFFKKEHESAINNSVFPGLQGGPHNHQIAALATQLKEVASPEFKKYIRDVVENARACADEFMKLGYDVSTGGTDNHIVLINLKNKGIKGTKMEELCNLVNISINKNAVYGDTAAASPSGIRLGTSSLTTRGFQEDDIRTIVHIMDDVVKCAVRIQKAAGNNKMKDFRKFIHTEQDTLHALSERVKVLTDKYELYA